MLPLIRTLIKPYKGSLLIILAAMVIQIVASLAAPWPLKVVLDNVVGSHKEPAWLTHLLGASVHDTSKMHIALFAGLAVLVIAFVNAVSSYVANYYTESVGQWVAHDLRKKTYHHLERLSLTYFEGHQTGNILSTITNDIGTIQGFASASTLGILVDLLTIVAMIGLMFYLDLEFAVVALAVTPFLGLFLARFKTAVKKATKAVRKEQADMLAVIQQGLESERVVKAFGQQELEEEELDLVSRRTVDAALKARRVKSLLSPIVTVTVALCTGYVLWRGAGRILAGEMTAGALTVFLAYLSKFFKPVQDLAKMTNVIAATTVGVERVQAILEDETIIAEKPDAKEPGILRGEIVFDHVAFGYNAGTQVLKDVNFTIQPGQLVGVVGPTGGGKSTVVSLIPRFYDATKGTVRIDGMDVRDLTLAGLRKNIGFVLQDTVLFRGTIRDNIAYGRPAATKDEVMEAAKLANAHDFILAMPKGYDTQVGERGLTLSGGQRQRIGIARALIRDNPILILDEPTAALDTESERLVVEALERLMKGRTVITIAHRLSTIRDASKIIVLKGGVVAEQGTNDELVALDGVYAELHRIQFGDAPKPVGR